VKKKTSPDSLKNISMKIVTIGVYGATEDAFFRTLRDAAVDTFCDIRWRRGMRGSDYAFANSARLQKRLCEMGIRYLHLREVAPPPLLRQRQADADKASGTAKRQRSELGEAFIAGYREECLSSFDSAKFIEKLGPEARVVALFCVEREPVACHRYLLAERLRQDLRSEIDVVHLRPDQALP
jgi:uncharacterized protein (DUF488 family)